METRFELDQQYWDKRYQACETGWDLGEVSPPIKAYIDQLERKDIAILIPGCGNSYEAAYLLQQGFTNITLIDIAPALVADLQQKFAGNPHIHLILGDFFEHQGQYDLILEQTFFCALPPAMRKAYADKMLQLLAPSGKLSGLLFDTYFEKQGPPFGGSKQEYLNLFASDFTVRQMENCYNSYPKRSGTELFFILSPKNNKHSSEV